MSGDGAYIILTRDDAKLLFAQKDDESVRKAVEQLRHSERHRAEGLVLDCGADWDPIHRALTDGSLDPNSGEFPLDHCVLGGRQLHAGAGYRAVLIRPDIVPHVAKALHDLKRAEFHQRYIQLDPAVYGRPPTDEESDRVWSTLKLIRQMFEDASNDHAAVVFACAG